MFHRFDDRARKAMALARKEALRLGQDFIGTEHLLLGMIADRPGSMATEILAKRGLDLRRIRGEVEKKMAPAPGRGESRQSPFITPQLPFTPRAKKVLEFAMEEADRLGHRHIGTEHVLLGLLREDGGLGGQVLRSLGLSLEKAGKDVELLGGATNPGGSNADRAPAEAEAEAGGIQRFELTDFEGKVRARLALDDEGSPWLQLLDAGGVARLVLGLAADGTPSIEFRDADGTVTERLPRPEGGKSG